MKKNRSQIQVSANEKKWIVNTRSVSKGKR